MSSASEFERLELIGELLEYRAAKAAMEGALEVQLGMASKSPFAAFNSSLPFANNKAAIFYGELFMFQKAHEKILECKSEKNKSYLGKILAIYGLTAIKEASEFYLDYLTSKDISMIDATLLKLFEEVKHNMIASMNFLYQEDHILKSAIGSSDGNIYDRLISKINSGAGNMGKAEDWKDLYDSRKAAQFANPSF